MNYSLKSKILSFIDTTESQWRVIQSVNFFILEVERGGVWFCGRVCSTFKGTSWIVIYISLNSLSCISIGIRV